MKDDPAFPSNVTVNIDNHDGLRPYTTVSAPAGLTKREWFAGMALVGILSTREWGKGRAWHSVDEAIEAADQMIRHLKYSKEDQKNENVAT